MKVKVILIVMFFLIPTLVYGESLDDGLHIQLPSSWNQTKLDNKDENLIYHAENGDLELGIYSKRDLKSNLTNSWANYSNEQLRDLAETAMDTHKKKSGTVISNWSQFDNKQMRFLRFQGKVVNEEGDVKYFTQYTTIQNGGTLQFSFYKETNFTNADIAIMDSLVKSAHYDTITGRSVDTIIICKLSALLLVIVLLVGSVIWNIRRYRRKHVINERKETT